MAIFLRHSLISTLPSLQVALIGVSMPRCCVSLRLACRRNASPTERAPPPRKTCPSVVLRALGKFPHRRPTKPLSGHAKLNSEVFAEGRTKGLVVGAINIRRAAPSQPQQEDTPIPEQCPLEQFLIVFWQTKPSFFEAPTESERPTWYRRATSLCRFWVADLA